MAPTHKPKPSPAMIARLGWLPGEIVTEEDARQQLLNRLSWGAGDVANTPAGDGRERVEGPTPSGGAYAMAAYVKLETLEVVPKIEADGVIITEYDAEGHQVAETVMARTS